LVSKIEGRRLRCFTFEEVELATRVLALPPFENDSSLQHTRCGYQSTCGRSDGTDEGRTFRFGEESGCKRGCVNYHLRGSVELDNSVTFGGFHWNNPREVNVELRYRFHC